MARLPEPHANHIYGLSCACHPEKGYRYIGLTSQGAERRLWAHRKLSRRGKRWPVYFWMRKHGDMSVISTVIEELEAPEELPEAEIRWIAHYRALGQADLNLTEGGEGAFGYVMPDDVRKAHSERMKREWADGTRTPSVLSPEGRERMVAAARLRMNDPEFIAEHARKVKEKWQTNPEMTEAIRARLSPFSEDDVAAIRDLYRSGEATYAEIAEAIGASKTTIGQIVRGDRWNPDGGRRSGTAERLENYRPNGARRMSEAGRASMLASRVRGEASGAAKLTAASVAEIRKKLWNGELIAELAAEFDISRSAVAHISADHNWHTVPWPIGPRCKPGLRADKSYRVGENSWAAKLTEADVIEIRRRYDAGETAKQIQPDYSGIGYKAIWCAATRRTWKHLPQNKHPIHS